MIYPVSYEEAFGLKFTNAWKFSSWRKKASKLFYILDQRFLQVLGIV